MPQSPLDIHDEQQRFGRPHAALPDQFIPPGHAARTERFEMELMKTFQEPRIPSKPADGRFSDLFLSQRRSDPFHSRLICHIASIQPLCCMWSIRVGPTRIAKSWTGIVSARLLVSAAVADWEVLWSWWEPATGVRTTHLDSPMWNNLIWDNLLQDNPIRY